MKNKEVKDPGNIMEI